MSKKIFLIDDEEQIRKMYKETFVLDGHIVETCQNGQQAVEKLITGQPDYDLILLDIMMPGLDGINVLKRIKADISPARHIPVFMLTNLFTEPLKQEALSLGAKQFLSKIDLTPKTILEIIDNFFSSSEVQP